MGQEQNHQDVAANLGRSPARKAGYRLLATLVGFGLLSVPHSQDPVAPAKPFSGEAAYTYLKQQCEFGPRVPGTVGHAKAKTFIQDEATKYADKVELQNFTHRWTKTRDVYDMTNVLAFQNWEKATTRVILLAHWDTRPSADMEARPSDRLKPIAGANDGASGVAVLLELMKTLKGRTGSVGICYAFVDGEDLGPDISEMFLGAEYLSRNLPSPKPQYGILLDMIGDAELAIPKEEYSNYYAPELMKALYLHAASLDMRSTFPNVIGSPILDDHLSLNRAGVPTIDLIDFDYPYWHTLQDTPDKCSAESLGKVGKLLETWFTKPTPWTLKR